MQFTSGVLSGAKGKRESLERVFDYIHWIIFIEFVDD